MSKYIESYWAEELPIIDCTQREIYFHRISDRDFIIVGTEEEYENWDKDVLLAVPEFLPPLENGIYLEASMKEKEQLYFFYIPHLREWRKERKTILNSK